MTTLGRAAASILLISLLAPPPAAADEYDPQRAGHPLRIAAYAAHPVGVILDWLIFRPAWWLGQKEPIKTLVGMESEDQEILEVQAAAPTPEGLVPSAPESTPAPESKPAPEAPQAP